jgi:hypothetical protein
MAYGLVAMVANKLGYFRAGGSFLCNHNQGLKADAVGWPFG